MRNEQCPAENRYSAVSSPLLKHQKPIMPLICLFLAVGIFAILLPMLKMLAIMKRVAGGGYHLPIIFSTCIQESSIQHLGMLVNPVS